MSSVFKDSPWTLFPRENGCVTIAFRVDGIPVVEIDLDSDNKFKLAEMLLEPIEYNPTPKGVSVRLCQKK